MCDICLILQISTVSSTSWIFFFTLAFIFVNNVFTCFKRIHFYSLSYYIFKLEIESFTTRELDRKMKYSQALGAVIISIISLRPFNIFNFFISEQKLMRKPFFFKIHSFISSVILAPIIVLPDNSTQPCVTFPH